MRDFLDELEWATAYAERKNAATFPTSVARRIVAGESPVRVYREYREMIQSELAKKSGVTQSYLAAIETGKKPGSASALKAIADVLGIPMDVLVANA